MDIEELKLVLEAVGGLAQGGKEAFIWWLVAEKVIPVVAWMVALGVSALLGRWAIRHFAKIADYEKERDAANERADAYFRETMNLKGQLVENHSLATHAINLCKAVRFKNKEIANSYPQEVTQFMYRLVRDVDDGKVKIE